MPALQAKRLLDLALTVPLLVLLLPLMGLIALLIALDDPGPPLFIQTRIGWRGVPFRMFKFRTMRVGAHGEWLPPASPNELMDYVFQDTSDPRITRLGRILRKTSLDELPQLANVIMGSMSLVGPRPEIPEMVALYSPEMHRRHKMPPGITGWAQISGRGTLSTGKILQYDLEYCDDWRFSTDLKILWQTLLVVIARKGAR